MTDKEPNYVATCPVCKNIIAAAVADTPKKELREYLGDWMLRLLVIERLDNDAVRTRPWGHAPECVHKEVEQQLLFS